jgi:hypothetical protein
MLTFQDQPVVLGVADDAIGVCKCGGSARSNHEFNRHANEQMVVDQSMAVTDVELLFQLPKPERKSSGASKRKLTSNRILTSTEIIREKQKQIKKEPELEIKEEQKQARQLKQEQNAK